MRAIQVFATALAVGFVIALPSTALAQQSSLGVFAPIWPEEGPCNCPGSAPDWGCALDIFDRAIDVAVGILVIWAVLWIAYAGFSFMTSSVRANPNGIEEARTRLTNAVLGLAVVLCAWVLVDFVMKALYNPEATLSGENIGPWQEIWVGSEDSMCIKVNYETGDIISGEITLVPGTSPSGQVATAGTTGRRSAGCTVSNDASNPCSVQFLSTTCFSSLGQHAARVCMMESAGRSQPSGSDKLNSGRGPSYSYGIWQINITAHRVGGLNCPSAFTCMCGARGTLTGRLGHCNCSVRSDPASQQLFRRCVDAAMNPRTNVQAACVILSSSTGGTMRPWACSAQKCSVPGARNVDSRCAPGR